MMTEVAAGEIVSLRDMEAVLSQIRTIVFHVSETETDGVCLRGVFVGVCGWMGVHMCGWVWLCSVKRRPGACDAAILVHVMLLYWCM